MNRIDKLLKFLQNEDYRFDILSNKHFFDRLSDEEFIKRKFKALMGRELDLTAPVTFNEKLQWLKINDHKEEYTFLVDKYKVREYVKEKIGEKYLIPLLGSWYSPEKINFNELPNRFVLKCNHNSGLGMCICKNKSSLNINRVKKELKKGLNQDYYLLGREWPYKNVERRIIAEEYIGVDGKSLEDYKFFVFNGEIDSVMVCQGREFGHPKFFFYDINWKRLYYQKDEIKLEKELPEPSGFKEMIDIVRKLSNSFKEVRVDLYNVDGKIYFGELTFFNNSGFDTDITYDTDKLWGEKIELC